MKFSFNVGKQNVHPVSFSWNQIWGSLNIKVDGKTVAKKNIQLFSTIGEDPDNPAWYFAGVPIQLLDKWEFIIEDSPDIKVRIEKRRPKVFPALRPHSYCAIVDDEVILDKTGF